MGDVPANLGIAASEPRGKLNVLLVSPYDFGSPGGVTEHVTQLDQALRRVGHRTSIIAPMSKHPEIVPPENLISAGGIVAVPTNGSVARISLSLTLDDLVVRTLSDFRPDIVHIHEPFMPLLPYAVLRHSRAANVVTFHAYSGNDLGYRYGRRLLEHYFDRVDGRITVSAAAKSFISRHFPGSYAIIPNGVDMERFQNREPLPELRDGHINLLFVGRLDERKGFNVLLPAFAQVRRRQPNVRLIVVGAHDPTQIARHKARIEAIGLPDVHFLGYATSDHLARYYASSDIVCAPSLGGESFGMVLLEGMAAGKAIVASRIPGYRDLVDDGIEGLLAPPGDVEALGTALELMVGNQEQRETMGRRGSLKARSYSWSLIGERISDFYDDTLRRGGSMKRGSENPTRMPEPVRGVKMHRAGD